MCPWTWLAEEGHRLTRVFLCDVTLPRGRGLSFLGHPHTAPEDLGDAPSFSESFYRCGNHPVKATGCAYATGLESLECGTNKALTNSYTMFLFFFAFLFFLLEKILFFFFGSEFCHTKHPLLKHYFLQDQFKTKYFLCLRLCQAPKNKHFKKSLLSLNSFLQFNFPRIPHSLFHSFDT